MEKQVITKTKLYRILDEQSTGHGDHISFYIKASSFSRLGDRILLKPGYSTCSDKISALLNDKIICRESEKYDTGIAIFWQEVGPTYFVLPPFPIIEDKVIFGSFELYGLHEIMEKQYTLGIILVTWGSYAVGVFHDDKLLNSKVGTGHIHKEHKKGGSSQKRFARRTEEQRKEFLRKVSYRVEEKFSGYTLDFVFFGGNRLICKPLLNNCKYLQTESAKLSKRIINVKHANQESLEQSFKEIKKPLLFTSPPAVTLMKPHNFKLLQHVNYSPPTYH